MREITFPGSGDVFTTTAQTPQSISTLFQNLVAQILGYPVLQQNGTPMAPGSDAWNNVRIDWPQGGQPAWPITQDVCFIQATTDDDPFSRVSDYIHAPNNDQSLNQQMAYTQVWRMHFCNYGPNSFSNAGIIVAAFSLDWVHDVIAASNIYSVTTWTRPQNVPELFEGQWWPRADVSLRFNELVNLNLIVPLAASVDVTLLKENGLSETVKNSI